MILSTVYWRKMKRLVFSSVLCVLCQATFAAGAIASSPASSIGARTILPIPPGYTETIQQSETDFRDGKAALRAKDFAAAEASFRAAISGSPTSKEYCGLAEALTAQGRIAEAIQTYRTVFYDLPVENSIGCDTPAIVEAYHKEFSLKVHADPTRYSRFGSNAPKAWMIYALLLSQTGQWEEAVYFYENALPDVPSGGMMKIDVHFDPAVPQPVAFQAAAHMALGVLNNFGGEIDSNDKAMKEYQMALQLEPDWPITNYYYSFGWKHLGPKSCANFADVQQAKATLLKAINLGMGNVR